MDIVGCRVRRRWTKIGDDKQQIVTRPLAIACMLSEYIDGIAADLQAAVIELNDQLFELAPEVRLGNQLLFRLVIQGRPDLVAGPPQGIRLLQQRQLQEGCLGSE